MYPSMAAAVLCREFEHRARGDNLKEQGGGSASPTNQSFGGQTLKKVHRIQLPGTCLCLSLSCLTIHNEVWCTSCRHAHLVASSFFFCLFLNFILPPTRHSSACSVYICSPNKSPAASLNINDALTPDVWVSKSPCRLASSTRVFKLFRPMRACVTLWHGMAWPQVASPKGDWEPKPWQASRGPRGRGLLQIVCIRIQYSCTIQTRWPA
jgi:hypothetical protein